MNINSYYLKARLFPTIICSIPILSLYFFGFSEEIDEFIKFLNNYKWVADATISIALIFLLTQINRFVAKEVFQSLFFKDELYMPTTNYLLHSNNYLAMDTKKRIRQKINLIFKINLPSKKVEETDELEVRKLIVEAVAQIRNFTRENSLLLQHNLEYGFVRNLIGGSAVAFLISLINLLIFKLVVINSTAFYLNLIFSIIFIMPVFLSKFLIRRYGKYYAKILFDQFLKT